MNKLIIFICFVIFTKNIFSQAVIKEKLGNANISFADNKLTASTGKFERTWNVTSNGLITTSLKNIETGRQWVDAPTTKCDWSYLGLITDTSTCNLLNISAQPANDEGFTSDFLMLLPNLNIRPPIRLLNTKFGFIPMPPACELRFGSKGKPPIPYFRIFQTIIKMAFCLN